MAYENTRRAQGARLAAARKKAGWRSARSFALENGLKESTYSAHENGGRTIGLDDAERYAKRFRLAGVAITAQDILFDSEDQISGFHEETLTYSHEPSGIPIRGAVAAGAWLDPDVGDIQAFDPIPVAYDTRWPADAQFGLVVRGTSINKFASDGDVLVCVSLAETGVQIVEEDLVIVERIMQQGGLREVTAKRARFKNGSIELWPESTDPQFQKPLLISRQYATADDGIRIIARVEWAYKSTRRR